MTTSLAGPAVRVQVRPWRALIVALGCFLGGLVTLYLFVAIAVATGEAEQILSPGRLALDLLGGLVACVLVAFGRRRAWVSLLIVAFVLTGVVAGVAAMVSLTRIGARLSWRLNAAALAVVAVGVPVALWLEPTPPDEELLPLIVGTGVLLLFTALFLLWGHSRGTRAALLDSLRARAAGAQREAEAIAREHEAEVARVRAEERAAIARDMHDSLSHQLSLVALHAGALAYREDLTVEQRQLAARTLRDAAGRASGELREVLSSLRGVEEFGPAVRPLPDAGSLHELVERANRDGQRVSLEWRDITPEELALGSRAVAVAYARITQELLINAAKHAPEQQVSVIVAGNGDRVSLTVTNPALDDGLPAIGTGLGLVGVAERARLLGGTMEQDQIDGRFRVRVTLPWRGQAKPESDKEGERR